MGRHKKDFMDAMRQPINNPVSKAVASIKISEMAKKNEPEIITGEGKLATNANGTIGDGALVATVAESPKNCAIEIAAKVTGETREEVAKALDAPKAPTKPVTVEEFFASLEGTIVIMEIKINEAIERINRHINAQCDFDFRISDALKRLCGTKIEAPVAERK